MANFVDLDGYITDASAVLLFSPDVNVKFTLNVPKGGNSKGFYYIPIATEGITPENGTIDSWFTGEIHVGGELETYPDSRGRQHWHVVADSIKLITFNPFAPRKSDEKDYNPFAPKNEKTKPKKNKDKRSHNAKK